MSKGAVKVMKEGALAPVRARGGGEEVRVRGRANVGIPKSTTEMAQLPVYVGLMLRSCRNSEEITLPRSNDWWEKIVKLEWEDWLTNFRNNRNFKLIG